MTTSEFITSDFSIIIPQHWKKKLVCNFYDDSSDGIKMGIVVTQDSLDVAQSIDEFKEQEKESLRKQLSEFQFIEETTVDGVFYQRIPPITYSWTPTALGPIVQRQAFIAENDTVWTITGTSSIPDVILAHELVHAYHNATGTNGNGPRDLYPNQGGTGSSRGEERQTFGGPGGVSKDPDGKPITLPNHSKWRIGVCPLEPLPWSPALELEPRLRSRRQNPHWRAARRAVQALRRGLPAAKRRTSTAFSPPRAIRFSAAAFSSASPTTGAARPRRRRVQYLWHLFVASFM